MLQLLPSLRRTAQSEPQENFQVAPVFRYPNDRTQSFSLLGSTTGMYSVSRFLLVRVPPGPSPALTPPFATGLLSRSELLCLPISVSGSIGVASYSLYMTSLLRILRGFQLLI